MPTVWETGLRRARPWLILGRISNLPTVWSNCLAAWLMCGGGSFSRFLWVLVGGTLIYVGGMFLNDACDAGFDAAHRGERPIPAGHVSRMAVWIAAGVTLTLGWIVVAQLGFATMGLGFLLVVSVVVYDVVHKGTSLSPWIMALCRYLLFLTAASASAEGVSGAAVWSAFALAAYVVGLSYVARQEAVGGLLAYWPMAMLAAPVVLVGFMNAPSTWGRSTVFGPVLLMGLWTMRSLSHLWRGEGGDGARKAVSGLLAGMVWVDVVAVQPPAWPWGGWFLGLFVMALLLQRRVPAT